MDMILIKILATFLAFSQVMTRPDAVRTHFDATRDQAEVTHILRDGCAHMREAFGVEALDLDDLIKIAVDDPASVSDGVEALHGLKVESLLAVYRQFCKDDEVKDSPVDVGRLIIFYNGAVADLPDHTRLKYMRDPGAILDGRGERFAELPDRHRRVWVQLKDIPASVRQAFIAAEDKRFYEHKGLDEHGLIRAMMSNLARSGRPQGGSTITQQVVKNLLVGDDVTYERKLREIIIAARLERSFGKAEILELYLNSIYLGRGAWGIELAARNYFGKPASELTLAEGAMLAGLPKGPTYYGPDRHPEHAQERLNYVLGRMREDGDTAAAALEDAKATLPRMVGYDQTERRDAGYYFTDQVARDARRLAGVGSLAGLTIRTTVRPELQRAAESALQEGLAQYEMRNGRTEWRGAEANLAGAVRRLEAEASAERNLNAGTAGRPEPVWQRALQAARLPLQDVRWSTAIVLGTSRNGEVTIGLADGRTMPLSATSQAGRGTLNLYDVVLVRVGEASGRQASAELRVRPTVQGAAVVLDNRTGAILAMAGGFSHQISQLNRVTQTQRQPGSLLKPFTYLAALRSGLQPNTLVRDRPLTLPPIDPSAKTREKDYWTPKDYDRGGGGVMTLRHGLENSVNLVTANLLDGGISSDPRQSLARVCDLAVEAQIYRTCAAYYPFILGAQPARLIDMAAFYASIATEGRRPSPHTIESIVQNRRKVYTYTPEASWLASGDRAAFFQLRTMLQGVVARGTARAIAHLAPYVGGKTGTTEDENDAWFIGFTNDVTIGIWVGYDNADGKRRTLGDGQTGGEVAVPIFAPIVEATWASYARKTPLAPPSSEAMRELVALPIDLESGNRLASSQGRGFTEYFRLRRGRLEDTQYRLVSPNERVAAHDPRGGGPSPGRPDAGAYDRGYYAPQQGYPGGNYPRGNYPVGSNGRGPLPGDPAARFAPGPAQRPPYPSISDAPDDTRPRYSRDPRLVAPPRVDPRSATL
jgi:penicillin-binding protein 1A